MNALSIALHASLLRGTEKVTSTASIASLKAQALAFFSEYVSLGLQHRYQVCCSRMQPHAASTACIGHFRVQCDTVDVPLLAWKHKEQMTTMMNMAFHPSDTGWLKGRAGSGRGDSNFQAVPAGWYPQLGWHSFALNGSAYDSQECAKGSGL